MTPTTARPSTPIPADARWQAVAARDRAADGTFVYAVLSTGIYCRPSCPSRRPRRDRVRFFDGPPEAARAGFRACRRCRPDAAAGDPISDKVARAAALIDAAGEEGIALARLARAVGCSPGHLQRAFVRLLGVSPREYAAARRAERLKRGLRDGAPVLDAVFGAGFGSTSRVYEASRVLGMTPAQYRRSGKGVRIEWTTARSPLGTVLVAGTDRGIAAVMLGDSASALETALRAEYPAATFAPGGASLARAVAAILDHLAGRPARLDAIPLDVQATAFQRRVWKALQQVPPGETQTYAALAARIGQPSAARAVARACATNPVAIVVPCHRVVPAVGGTGGYRWGAERKRALLAAERRRSGR